MLIKVLQVVSLPTVAASQALGHCFIHVSLFSLGLPDGKTICEYLQIPVCISLACLTSHLEGFPREPPLSQTELRLEDWVMCKPTVFQPGQTHSTSCLQRFLDVSVFVPSFCSRALLQS